MDKAIIVFNKYAEAVEFEKTAFPFAMALRPAVAFAKSLRSLYKVKGLRATLGTAAKYRDPAASMAKGVKNIGAMRYGARRSWGVRELGNIAHNLSILGRGVTRAQPVSRSFAQASKNIVEMGKRQLRAARYKTVRTGPYKGPLSETGRFSGIRAGINKIMTPGQIQGGVLKGRGPLGLFRTFDRKVVGTAGKNLLVSKRKGMLPLSYAMTAPGFAATDVAFTKGGIKEKVKAGAKSYALWGVSPTIGMAAMLAGK